MAFDDDPFKRGRGVDDLYGPVGQPVSAPQASTTPLPGSVSPPQQLPPTQSTQAPPATPPPAWNTDGFATPGYVAPTFKYDQAKLGGWDQNKFADPNHQTPKYVLGRILSNYPDNPGGLQAAMADVSRAYPGARMVNPASGKIFLPGVGTVDAGVSFGSGGGHGWGFQLVADANGNPIAEPGAPAAAPSVAAPGVMSAPSSGTAQSLVSLLATMFAPRSTASQAAAVAPAPVAAAAPAQASVSAGSDGFTPAAPQGGAQMVRTPDGLTVQVGSAVPNQQGYVYNSAGGVEPGGAGNAVPGMPGSFYGGDGYSVATPGGASPSVSTVVNPSAQPVRAPQVPGYGNITPGQYSDPATNDLLEFIRTRIPDLLSQGTQTPDSIQDLLAMLQGAATNTANSPETARLQDLLTQAVGRATGPAYSDSQKATIRADHLAQLQSAHDRAIQEVTRDLAARNIPLDSGVAREAFARVSDQYARNKSMVERGLAVDEISKVESNRALALQAAGESANVATAQQGKVLEFMKLIADVNSNDVNVRNAAMDKALSLFSVPVSIADQRFQDANAAANGASGNPSSLLSTLATIASNNNAINSQNQIASKDMWTNIAKAVATIDWSGKKGNG